ELVGAAAEGEAHDLVAEADAEDRHLAEEPGDRLAGTRDRVRIAGPVGEEDAIGPERQDLARGRRRGHDAHLAAGADQAPEDVPLDAEVVGDDPVGGPIAPRGDFPRRRVAPPELPRTLGPVVRPGTRDLAHEIAADQSGRLLGAPDEALRIEIDARDDGFLR